MRLAQVLGVSGLLAACGSSGGGPRADAGATADAARLDDAGLADAGPVDAHLGPDANVELQAGFLSWADGPLTFGQAVLGDDGYVLELRQAAPDGTGEEPATAGLRIFFPVNATVGSHPCVNGYAVSWDDGRLDQAFVDLACSVDIVAIGAVGEPIVAQASILAEPAAPAEGQGPTLFTGWGSVVRMADVGDPQNQSPPPSYNGPRWRVRWQITRDGAAATCADVGGVRLVGTAGAGRTFDPQSFESYYAGTTIASCLDDRDHGELIVPVAGVENVDPLAELDWDLLAMRCETFHGNETAAMTQSFAGSVTSPPYRGEVTLVCDFEF
jgi:hypothetical protein